MGVVYEGRSDDGEPVAIKVVRGAVTPSIVRRFTREGELISRIRHPNVVKVSAFGTSEDGAYIVMELLHGEPLSRALARERRFAVPRLVDVFLPILSAVAAIHRATVIHRDLKLANVMLAHREGSGIKPVVLDFGISKSFESAVSEDTGLTRSHAILGTLAYLSPEQTLNARAVSPFSDQYALGVMLYELATGSRPFQGPSQYEMMHAILHQPVRPPSELAPELPAALDAVILRAMQRDVTTRYPSVRALAHDLLAVAEPAVRARWLAEFGEGVAAADISEVTVVDERSCSDARRARTSGRVLRSAATGIVLAVATIAVARQSSTRGGAFGSEPSASATSHAAARSPGHTAARVELPPLSTGMPPPGARATAPAPSSNPPRRRQVRATSAKLGNVTKPASKPANRTARPEPVLHADDAIDPFASRDH